MLHENSWNVCATVCSAGVHVLASFITLLIFKMSLPVCFRQLDSVVRVGLKADPSRRNTHILSY